MYIVFGFAITAMLAVVHVAPAAFFIVHTILRPMGCSCM
jgi:hypothetical protein